MANFETSFDFLTGTLNQLDVGSNRVPTEVVEAIATLVYFEANGLQDRIDKQIKAERKRLLRLLAFPHIRALVIDEDMATVMLDGRVGIAEALGVKSGVDFQYVRTFKRPSEMGEIVLHDIGRFDQLCQLKTDVPSLRTATFAEVVFLLAKRFGLDLTLPIMDDYQEGMAEAGYSQTALMRFIYCQFQGKSKKHFPAADPVVVMILAVISERDLLDLLYVTKNTHGNTDLAQANLDYEVLRNEALSLIRFPVMRAKIDAFVAMCFDEEQGTRLLGNSAKARELKQRVTNLRRIHHDLVCQLESLNQRINAGPLEVADLPTLAAAQSPNGDRQQIEAEMSLVERRIADINTPPELDDELIKAREFLRYLKVAIASPSAQSQLQAWLLRRELRKHLYLLQAELLDAKAAVMKIRF